MQRKVKRYTEYSDAINDFGNSAYNELREKLVDVPAYQLTQLDEACFLLNRIEECKKVIKKDGLTVRTPKGELKAHPSLTTQNQCQNQFHKIINALMLTMSARDKARKADHTDENKALEALLNP